MTQKQAIITDIQSKLQGKGRAIKGLVVCNIWDASDLSTQTIENKILPSSTGLEKLYFF